MKLKYWNALNQKIATLILKGLNDEFMALMLSIYSWWHFSIYEPFISLWNNKIGRTWNFSIPAVFTCGKRALETCGKCHGTDKNGKKKKYCYALKDYRNPSVTAFRFINLFLILYHMAMLEVKLDKSLSDWEQECARKGRKPYARLHESGEFVSLAYLRMWIRIAKRHPGIMIYTYSTRYEWLREVMSEIPENLQIRPSGWEDREIPDDVKEFYGQTIVIDKASDLPKGFFLCPANGSKKGVTCEKCGYKCAHFKNIAFIYHN